MSKKRGTNVVEGRIDKNVFLGDFIDCQIRVSEQMVRAKLQLTSDLNEGEQVLVQFDPHACIVIPGTA